MPRQLGGETNLWVRFEQVVRGGPTQIAVDDGIDPQTYGNVYERALRISSRLSRVSHDSGPILLFFEHVTEAIPAILACCRLGCPYVPVRPDDALSRVSWILENSSSQILLTEQTCLDQAAALADGREVLVCDDGTEPASDASTSEAAEAPDALWIIYTSGSTGRPKGVVQTHCNLAQYAETYAKRLSIVPGDRISLLLSYSANFANHLVFMALLNGATLCPYDIHGKGAGRLARWLEARQVSVLVSVPTLFRHVFGTSLDVTSGFPAIRWVMLIGEPVSRHEFEIFGRAFSPQATLCNRYGSTETGTVAWRTFRVGDRIEGSTLPIGEPGAGFDVLLLDNEGRQVSSGSSGEMVVRSAFLSSGYWQDPVSTAQVFSSDPELPGLRRYRTGDLAQEDPVHGLIHLGRKDFQVQVRGHRVEPAEIEEALRSHPAIDDAFVHVLQENDEEPRIIGYLVCRDQAPTVTVLRHHLSQRIPAAMIPHAFIELDAFPLAPNGKVNRSALPRPSGQRPRLDAAFVAPESPFEIRLAEIWRDLLGIEEIGALDSFFDLGGDSLKAMRLMTRIEAQFGVAPGLERFHEQPMIGATARWLLQQMAA